MSRKRIALIVLSVVAILIAINYFVDWRRARIVEGSGTVEARNIRVGSKVGGRIKEVLVSEGQRVDAGQVIVTFEDQELEAALQQARGRYEAAKANYEKMQRGLRPEEIVEARANAAQAAAALAEARNGFRKEQVAAVQAELERARAEAANAETDYHRAEELWSKGVVSRQFRDNAETRMKAARAAAEAAAQRAQEYERGFRSEDIQAAEARFRQADANRRKAERGYRAEDIAAARADLTRAEGELKAAEDRYRERQVLAPTNAVVEVLDVRPGDLIAPNTPIALLLEREQIYVRIYVPETRIAKIALGQKADIRFDGFPDQVFEGRVEQINQKAEFLPRNVQTKEERVHQVIGVKLRIQDPENRIRAGMAADVRLRPDTGNQTASAGQGN